MHLRSIITTFIFSASMVAAAPSALPASIANPNTNSLHAPAHAPEARYVVDEAKYLIEPGDTIPEACAGGDGGKVRCKKLGAKRLREEAL